MFTDQKPLTHTLFRVSLPWSARQQCNLSYLAKFTSFVVHVTGPENVEADTLARPSLAPPLSALSLVTLLSQPPSAVLLPLPFDPVSQSLMFLSSLVYS